MTNNERTLGCDSNSEAGPSHQGFLPRSAIGEDSDGTSALMQMTTFRSDDRSIVEASIFDVLHHLHLAVNLVRAACDRQPQHRARLRQAFGALPWYLPMRVTDDVYAAHVNEQLERVVTEQSVSEGTRAEVLAVLSVWSHSLNESCAALYAQLARDLLGVEMKFQNDQRPRELSPGAAAQLLATLRGHLRVADRVVRIKAQ